MNKETIEQSADIYADKAPESYCNGYYGKYAIADAFEEGARWRINHAWHDFEDEMPEKKRPVLIESKSGGNNVFLLMVLQGDEEREDVASYRRWAYIEDLIPDMTEE